MIGRGGRSGACLFEGPHDSRDARRSATLIAVVSGVLLMGSLWANSAAEPSSVCTLMQSLGSGDFNISWREGGATTRALLLLCEIHVSSVENDLGHHRRGDFRGRCADGSFRGGEHDLAGACRGGK